MRQEILDRLITARFLLEHFGPPLNRHSDSRSVGRAVLMAHDASELALRSTADRLGIQIKKNEGFPVLIDETCSRLTKSDPKLFLRDLNNVRNSFKHHGHLPDSRRWFDVIDRAMECLNEICMEVFGISLMSMDLALLIADKKIVDLIKSAKSAAENGNFKGALENLADAVFKANSVFPTGLEVIPGDPDAQLALLLTGYGIDPSSFIIMQQLLPTVDDFGIRWKRRKMGHEGNWTHENVNFCLETAVQLILRLQDAHRRPLPMQFYALYTDVITVRVDSPQIRKGTLLELPDSESEGVLTSVPLTVFSNGSKISGRVLACSDMDGRFPDENVDLEDADWLRVDQPVCKELKTKMVDFLIVRREDVDVSYETDPSSKVKVRLLDEFMYKSLRKSFFDDDSQ